MKFLATPAAANAWAKEGGFATGQPQRQPRSVYPDAIDRADQQAVQTAKQVVFDMSDEQPAAFGSTTGQGEWGLFQKFLKNPSNATGIAKQLESGCRGGLQVRASSADERGRDHGGAAGHGGSACRRRPRPASAALPHRRRYSWRPTLFLLVVWLVYPTVYTIVRSFFGPSGFVGSWVGIDNYKTLFTTSTLTTAIKNNAIWVAVVPATRHARSGSIFAVLTEKVRWAVAFKTADLPADGDLGLRDRRHLADHVPAGSRASGRSTRSRRSVVRRLQPGRRPAAARSPRPRSCRRPRRARSC